VVYRVGLENRSRETDRGFESHPLRSLIFRELREDDRRPDNGHPKLLPDV
jgi:hypothetical protein